MLVDGASWQLHTPEEFDTAARFARPEAMRASVWISSGLGWPAERIAEPAELGFDGVQPHQVGRHQRAFIEAFGKRALPGLRRRARSAEGSGRTVPTGATFS